MKKCVTFGINGKYASFFFENSTTFRKLLLACTFLFSVAFLKAQHTVSIAMLDTNKCNGDCNASLVYVISGGIGPYSISGIGGNYITSDTTDTIRNLCVDSYILLVEDLGNTSGQGEVASTTFNIQTISAIGVAFNPTQPSCNGGCNGRLVAIAGGGTGSLTYNWSNAVSTSVNNNICTGTYTITVSDKNGCTKVASKDIGLNNSVIKGTVTFGGSNVTHGFVKLLEHRTDTILTMVDSVEIIGGTYLFNNIIPDDYILFAMADTVLVDTTVIGAYNGDVSNWVSATVLSLGNCDSMNVDIALIKMPDMSGTGTVTGQLIEGSGGLKVSQGFVSTGIQNVNVYLFEHPGGQLKAATITDTQGMFAFNNVDDGTYKVYVEIPGLMMDSVYTIIVSGGNAISNLIYSADLSGIYVSSPLSINKIQAGRNIRLFPNPNNGTVFISLDRFDGTVQLEIYNVIGEMVFENKMYSSNNVQLNHSLRAGIYTVKLAGVDFTEIERMIVK